MCLYAGTGAKDVGIKEGGALTKNLRWEWRVGGLWLVFTESRRGRKKEM